MTELEVKAELTLQNFTEALLTVKDAPSLLFLLLKNSILLAAPLDIEVYLTAPLTLSKLYPNKFKDAVALGVTNTQILRELLKIIDGANSQSKVTLTFKVYKGLQPKESPSGKVIVRSNKLTQEWGILHLEKLPFQELDIKRIPHTTYLLPAVYKNKSLLRKGVMVSETERELKLFLNDNSMYLILEPMEAQISVKHVKTELIDDLPTFLQSIVLVKEIAMLHLMEQFVMASTEGVNEQNIPNKMIMMWR